MARDRSRPSEPGLPRVSERLAPWLAGALLIGALQVVVAVVGTRTSSSARVVMMLGFCGSLAIACVMAVRTRRQGEAADHDERERPAEYEVSRVDPFRGPTVPNPSNYLESMGRWAEAMLVLTDHAATTPAAMEAGVAADLATASEDTRDLLELLSTNREVTLSVSAMATVCSVCGLWEVDRARIEPLAARVDPDWYRRWRARSVADRLVCRGERRVDATTLPYRN